MRSIDESEIQICIHSEKDPHSSKRALILTGSELNELTTLDWDKQKLKIVQEFQARDHIVGVTGDGVNDSPALKNADVGVAMGGGSQVAIEAAHMVLLDNNFASILVAIENGRLVFDNLKKVILYLLPAGSFSEMIPILVNVILGCPIPLSPFFMIVICVLTDIFSSMAIMCEKPESNLLLRSPRRPKKDRLTDRNLLIHAYAFLGIQET
ncbi:HAD-like protein, partial [Conidiobolus coronatus NRRL 28638]